MTDERRAVDVAQAWTAESVAGWLAGTLTLIVGKATDMEKAIGVPFPWLVEAREALANYDRWHLSRDELPVDTYHLTRVVAVRGKPHNFDAECSCGWVSGKTETHEGAWTLGRQHERDGTRAELSTQLKMKLATELLRLDDEHGGDDG